MRKPIFHRPARLVALLVVMACAVSPAAGQEDRLPIISRMQVVYSMVSHKMHLADRINFYNLYGNPKGATFYPVPHLVYEPIVTLYNPHNTVLNLPQSRVRLANPPVGFKFKKDGVYLRPEWESGDTFHGLGRFQSANESNANVQKTITLSLGGGNSENYAGAIVLQPGESKTFSVRVEQQWTWGLETAGGMNSRNFFDWDFSKDFTNRDARTNNLFGADAIPGLDFRTGFQTDWLSISNGRPAASIYPFETAAYGGSGWVPILGVLGSAVWRGRITVEAKGLNTTEDSFSPDFQLSLLRGEVVDPVADTAHEFSFSSNDLIRPGNDVPGNNLPGELVINRTFSVIDLLQTPTASNVAGKSPFAMFTIVARTKALQNRLFLANSQAPANQLYEARLDEITDFDAVNYEPFNGNFGPPVVTGVERVGDSLMLDVASQPGLPLGRVMGTTDPGLGFPDDLTASCVITPGPVGTGLFKVTVPVGGLGERYFVRIEH
ncbi:MAG: hypothetical protein V4640_04265 [Verrucomicrobiota bacterium]